jgi:peptide-methionine (S)-S-oxide reductase
LALESRDRKAETVNGRVLTRIEPLTAFYRAEDYHQKYYLRSEPELANYYLGIYPDAQAFVDSTATARVNGYLAGHGTREQLEAEAAELGLTSEALARLRALVARRR